MRSALLQRGVAEFVGTFTLIFVGAGAIIQTGGGNLTAIERANSDARLMPDPLCPCLAVACYNRAIVRGGFACRQSLS